MNATLPHGQRKRKKSLYVGAHCRYHRVRFDTGTNYSRAVQVWHERQSITTPPSTAFKTTFTVGTLIAIAIAASHWLLPQVGWW